ncbi:MAG: hypothetical protein HOI34_08615 [Rhodospirillaceae bacterium]|jgi:heterotetrameric sarcosine oxidase gamma subunit|nr:hypothetical protein [Rhodospirillaceae bacterium]MBT6203750.1 hypothetical protein [Rhodospirillaceae bacterium]MBT6511025.1 hypothetical protein [Rhodospirillaceae bacterium]MBT7613111.1 hypothetical protein [Rhodospirillaceae bacterium]
MINLHETAPIMACRILGSVEQPDIAGLARPTASGHASHRDNVSILMTSPDEWLVLDRDGNLIRDCRDLANQARVVVDESGAWRLFSIEGDGAFDLFAQFSPADLKGSSHPYDTCIATHAGGHPVIAIPVSRNRVDLLVARSYADSLLALLRHALRDS